jgi:caspase domain-containing protein
MSKNDRLVFYYSGYGGDHQGDTGYMLFGKARKGEFWGPQVLEVNALSIWSSELKIQHVLFIVDSCSSGLAFTAKAQPDNGEKLLLQTLGGNGSRTVLTAGTADEATYAMEDRNQLGNGVFTGALLGAFKSRRLSGDPLITVSDLFSDIEKRMAEFRVSQGKATTPRMWRLRESDFRGTFVFLNQRAGGASLTGEQAKALGITPVPKTAAEVPTGIIEVFSNDTGALSLDGQDVGQVTDGEVRQFFQQLTGKHQLEFRRREGLELATDGEAKDVNVESGRIAFATFGLKSPIDVSGKTPVGTFVLQSIHDLSGEVSIDGFPVGELKTNDKLVVANVTAGPHRWRLGNIKGSIFCAICNYSQRDDVQRCASPVSALWPYCNSPVKVRSSFEAVNFAFDTIKSLYSFE